MSLPEQQTRSSSNSAPPGRNQPAKSGPGPQKAGRLAKMPPRNTWVWFVLILLANFMLMRLLMPRPDAPVPVPYTLFKEQVGKRNVEAIYSRGEALTGRFKSPVTYPPPREEGAAPSGKPGTVSERGAAARGPAKPTTTFTTTLPSFVDPGLETFLIENGVEISAEPIDEGDSPWSTFLFGFGPALLLILFYVWLFRRADSRAAA